MASTSFSHRPLIVPLFVDPLAGQPSPLAKGGPSLSTSRRPVVPFLPTAVTTWGFDISPSDSPSETEDQDDLPFRGKGVAVGSSDGSLYLLQASHSLARPSSGQPLNAAPPVTIVLASPVPRPANARSPLSQLEDASHLSVRRASSPSGAARHRALPTSTTTSAAASRSASPGAGVAPTLSGATYRSSRLASISSVSTLQAAPPVLSGVEESVSDRKDDLRELLAGRGDGHHQSADYSALPSPSVSGRSSRPGSISSPRPLPPSITSNPVSPTLSPPAGAAQPLPFVQLAQSPLSEETRRSFSISQTHLPGLLSGLRGPSSEQPPPVVSAPAADATESFGAEEGHLQVWPPRASRRNPVVALASSMSAGGLIVLSSEGDLSIISADDGTVLRSTRLSRLDPALEGLEWSHLLALCTQERPISGPSDHVVLAGRPPERPWDDHCAEHKQEECSRLVLVNLQKLALVGAGTEVAGRLVGVELLASSSHSADILAYAEGPQTFVRLALVFPPQGEPVDQPMQVAQSPFDQGVSSKVDALKEFFQRNGHKDRLAARPEASGDTADEQAGLATWSGKTLPITESSMRLDLGQIRGLGILDKTIGSERAVIWGDYGLEVFHIGDGRTSVVATEEIDLFDVRPASQGLLVLTGPAGDALYSASDAPFLSTLSSDTADCAHLLVLPSGGRLKLSASSDALQLEYTSRDRESPSELWLVVPFPSGDESHITAVASAGDHALGDAFVGTSHGQVHRVSVSDVGPKLVKEGIAEPVLGGCVTALVHALDTASGQSHLVAGGEDGDLTALDPSTLSILARWMLFTSPVERVIVLDTLGSVRHACAIVLSEDGELAVIDLGSLKLSLFIPAAQGSLMHVFVADELLTLIYSDGRARQWDLVTCELRRSIDHNKALATAKAEGWQSLISCGGQMTAEDEGGSVLPAAGLASNNEALYLRLDLSQLLSASSLTLRADNDGSGLAKASHSLKAGFRDILSTFLCWSLDPEMDARAEEGLQAVRPTGEIEAVIPGVVSTDGSAMFANRSPSAFWEVSPGLTGTRLISLISMLQPYLAIESMESAASELISFYATRLPDIVGEAFRSASLEFYADFWLHTTPEIQQATRVLFGATLARTPDKALIETVERLQSELPASKPIGQRNTEASARALILIGQIVIENYSLFSAALLKDVAQSVTFYLDDATSPFRALGIDLCSAGFQIWQHYIDAMEVLRSLFHLATNKNPGGITLQARNASFHVASSNTPLFMTTLSYDIINATSPEQRNATMKLVALLAKRKPLILYSSLPRILEAVVKSLDPNVSVMRDTVHSTATVILESLVHSFPSVAFHGKSQKLGVGTLEGAVIVYDLKTATRLYVLEGHKHKVTACSFSPDGRRLVSVSLEESKVVIWKTGMSFTSLFNVGVPPRQGGPAPGDPFKTFDFNIGEEGNMTTLASLEWVTFEWPGERTARLRVRETALTFAT